MKLERPNCITINNNKYIAILKPEPTLSKFPIDTFNIDTAFKIAFEF